MKDSISFEESLKKLEEIAEKLENKDTTLEESITLFEEGMKYSKTCSEILNNAKQKIISLSDYEGEAEKND